jgi:class 3 adenylate cyclase/tetratricopeptide (TPR) repeat protein
MKCPRCQQDNPANLKFCGECGARLALLCAACGAANAPTQKFCGECGAALTQGAPAVKFASVEDYTPKHLAEKILNSKSALEGERKLVTVLFADLKGSMELLADSDPEEARKLLDPVLEHMMEAVHRYEGTVNQVMGDGIMALFGAPLALEDHAVRACYAALRMQESVRRYAESIRRTEGIPIQIRIGLNSGEVVVRSIGSDLHMDYTAVGQTTHLAARMEQLATPGSILIAPETLHLAEGYVIVRTLGPVAVKGLPAPVEVFELVGASTVRSRLQATAARGLTRFVGRDAEMVQLRQALERAGTGHGQIVAVVGEPGVGKSRLYWEFTHSHRTRDWLILESGSVSYGKATAYLPVIDLLKFYFQIEGRDEPRKVREKVTGKVLSLDRALEPSLPAFLSLLDVAAENSEWERLEPSQRRQQSLDGVKRLLLRESQVQPLLVLFEDLHWIDGETQALLDNLVESLPTARLLLLVNYRPEYKHGWGAKTYYRQLQIEPLPPESAEELLEALLGNDPTLPPLKRLLIERAEGNPFFLEESIRALVETQILAGERGGYRLEKRVQTLQIPLTAQAILAARIDRLPPEDKRLLQAAAVVGKDVPMALLQAIADEPEAALRAGLARLQAAEFLYEARLFPDLEFTFRHALTHEVAYTSLLHERRRALHARIVDAIERHFTDRLADQTDRLAHHALRGEVWELAVRYLRQAGVRAMARAANREAETYFEQAIVALGHLPERRETMELAVDLRFDLRTALIPLAEWERMQVHLGVAEALASTLEDQRRLARASTYMVIQAVLAQDYPEALRFGRQALAIGQALGDLSIEAPANAYLGLAHGSRGDHLNAIQHLERNVAIIPEDLRFERFGQATAMASFSRSILSLSLSELGRFDEAIARAAEAVRIAEEAGQHHYSLSFAWNALGVAHARRGDLERGAQVLERCVELCRASGFRVLVTPVASALAVVLAQLGREGEAFALVEEVASTLASRSLLGEYSLVSLASACLQTARADAAGDWARRALDAARDHGARGAEAHALRLLGEIACQHESLEPAAATNHYGEALALADELGMRPLVAHCHLGLGKFYRRLAKRAHAEERLGTAATLFREMDMRYWLAQAEAELKTLD